MGRGGQLGRGGAAGGGGRGQAAEGREGGRARRAAGLRSRLEDLEVLCAVLVELEDRSHLRSPGPALSGCSGPGS